MKYDKEKKNIKWCVCKGETVFVTVVVVVVVGLELRYSESSRSKRWGLLTDASGQTFGPILRGHSEGI